jgi:hypothetical protein
VAPRTPTFLRRCFERRLIQRNRVDDKLKFCEEVFLLSFQVLMHRFVFKRSGEISLCKHKIQYVLPICLLNELILSLQVTHLPFHLRHLLMAYPRQLLGLFTVDQV